MKTKQERKEEAWEEVRKKCLTAWKNYKDEEIYKKSKEIGWPKLIELEKEAEKEFEKKCKEIDNEVEE